VRLLNTCDTGATATMTAYTHCLTLRITPEMDDFVADAAYTSRQSKANWIRGAIHERLGRGRATATGTAISQRSVARQRTEE